VFPICPSCDLYEGDCECRISCNGANAAFIRANQWNYPGVSAAAESILKEKCGRNPKSGKTQKGGNIQKKEISKMWNALSDEEKNSWRMA